MSPYKLAIFDFDGTLADSLPWFLRTLNELSGKYGFRATSAEELEELRKMGNRELVAHLGVPTSRLPFLARELRRRVARETSGFRLFEGVEPMLPGLRARGLLTAVVSSNGEANVRAILGPRLAGTISHFECGASLFGKARLLKKTARQLGVIPGEAIYIGDEARDSEAARKAGMHFGFATWGYAHVDALGAKPNLVFAAPFEILDQLGK